MGECFLGGESSLKKVTFFLLLLCDLFNMGLGKSVFRTRVGLENPYRLNVTFFLLRLLLFTPGLGNSEVCLYILRDGDMDLPLLLYGDLVLDLPLCGESDLR